MAWVTDHLQHDECCGRSYQHNSRSWTIRLTCVSGYVLGASPQDPAELPLAQRLLDDELTPRELPLRVRLREI